MKKFLKISILKVLIVFLVIAIDLLTKNFFYQVNLNIIPELIGFRAVSGLNTGGAWSIFSSSTILLIVFTIIVVSGIAVFDVFYKKTNIVYSLSVSFLIGGAVGNLIDRIALGGVRDFIFFPFMPTFPTFNIADTFIFFGAVLLFIYVIFLFKPKNQTERTKKQEQQSILEEELPVEETQQSQTKQQIVETQSKGKKQIEETSIKETKLIQEERPLEKSQQVKETKTENARKINTTEKTSKSQKKQI